MSSFNKVIIMGNLTRDPELRSIPSGKQVCEISVALNEQWQDKDDTTQERVTFVDVTCWDKLASIVAQHKRKGDAVLIEGILTTDKWQDKETGKNRTKLKVTARNVTFIGKAPTTPRAKSEPESEGEYATEMPADEGANPY